jgi:succinate dehydrogenase/fumarate reductase flavoprotein subunit
MSNAIWDALTVTPLPEIRRRAAVLDDLAEVDPVTVPGAHRLAWNDGGGQSAVWYFTEDGRVLLLTFDHESVLNLYAEDDFALQESFFEGVPESLVTLVRDRPENYESLNLTDATTGRTIHYAGGVFWYDGTRWQVSDGLAEYCRREGVDLFGESGFDYCLDAYRLGQDFTPESIVAGRDEDGRYEDAKEREADLAGLREVFGRHR